MSGLYNTNPLPSDVPCNPTRETYASLQHAYDFFNHELFSGTLPHCLMTLQRKRNSYGYFCPNRFEMRGSKGNTDEIALNPTTFHGRTDEEVASTLVHEMVHLWQQHFGNPGRGRYHNREWAGKMEELGLPPYGPDGKRTGDRITHHIAQGGPFQVAWKKLEATGFSIKWGDRCFVRAAKPPRPDKQEEKHTDNSNRRKYTCPVCSGQRVGQAASEVAVC